MDLINHYIKNESLVEIPTDFRKVLTESLGLESILRGDGRLDIFIDVLERGELLQVKNKGPVKILDKTLWKKMKAELKKAEEGPASGRVKKLEHWKGRQGDFKKLTGTTLSNIAKKENGLGKDKSKTPSGEDWEAMIVVGLAINAGKSPTSECPKEWERVEKKWAKPYIDPTLKLAKKFKSNGMGGVVQSGTSKGSLSEDWKKWRAIVGGTNNTTAKTDLEGNGKKISLKKAGGSQAMSAKNGEAVATFYAACDILGEKQPSEVKGIVNKLHTGVMSMGGETDPYTGNIGDLEADLDHVQAAGKGNSGFSDKELGKLKTWKKRLDAGRKDATIVTSKMNELFLNNTKFKNAFVFEASSGSRKFGDGSPARADYLVEVDTDGGSITHEYSMSDENDEISSLSSKFKFYLSWKSSGNSSPYMALRGNLELDPKKVTAWMKNQVINENLVHNSICPTFSTIINEAFSKHGEVGKLLLEGTSTDTLNEWVKWETLKKKIKSGKDAVAGITKSAYNKFVQMWEWIKERVNVAFEWIKKQGRRALEFLLKFFGLEVNKCGINGPIELFSE